MKIHDEYPVPCCNCSVYFIIIKCVNLHKVIRIIIVLVLLNRHYIDMSTSYKRALTFGEPRRVIVDVAEGNVDNGGPSQSPELASHVLGLD